jgi:hypothetical protein
MASPSTSTLRPLVDTLTVTVPERTDANVATAMTLRFAAVEETRLTVRRSVDPQYTFTEPHVGQVVTTIEIRLAWTEARTAVAPSAVERIHVPR